MNRTEGHQLDGTHITQTVADLVNVHDWSKVEGLYLIGSFADPGKEIHEESDIDVVLLWESNSAFTTNQDEYPDGIRDGATFEPGYSADARIQTQAFGPRYIDVTELTPLDKSRLSTEPRIQLPHPR